MATPAVAGPSGPLKPPPSGTLRRSKWSACVDELFTKGGRVGATPEARARYFQDFFCLKVEPAELASRIDGATENQLLTDYHRNVSELFTNAVATLKQGGAEDFRCPNVIDLLSVLCRRIFAKRFVNWSLDVINLLAGSLENSDPVFTDLVASIDLIMRDPDVELPLRRKTLHLTLILVAGVNQGSINAYFLRRDLFNTLATLISEPSTASLTFESVLLLGLLANFRKYEARNPYLVRVEDYVDEKAMEKIIGLVEEALRSIRQAYLDVIDDTPPSFLGTVGSLVGSLRLSRRGSAPPPTLPPPPAPKPPSSATSDASSTSPTTTTAPSKPPPSTTPISSSEPFRALPPSQACILLPLYDMLHSNKTFLALLLAPDASFLSTYLSFASYLFSHASASPRSRAYARLTLVTILVLVEEGGRGMCHEERNIEVRFCRQRVPPLPTSADRPRPPICVILDCCVVFLRHNLQKKLNVDAYLVCLRLIHRILITLQAARVRIDYDWTSIWHALVSLGSLLAGRRQELESQVATETLAQQILDIFSFAAIWAEPLFKDTAAVASLYFEVLRADQTLSKVGDLAGVGAITPSAGVAVGSPRLGGLANGTKHGHSQGSSAGPGTIEAARNLRRIIGHFREKIDAEKQRRGASAVGGADEVMQVIARHIDSLDLIDSSSLESVARWSEVEAEVFMRDLTRHVSGDALDWVDRR